MPEPVPHAHPGQAVQRVQVAGDGKEPVQRLLPPLGEIAQGGLLLRRVSPGRLGGGQDGCGIGGQALSRAPAAAAGSRAAMMRWAVRWIVPPTRFTRAGPSFWLAQSAT